YRPFLLNRLGYPWRPVADHAAEALVALEDRDAMPQLIAMLDRPDPGVPFPRGSNRLGVREVVCLRHESNCLTCHPPAFKTGEPVPGVVPGVTLLSTRTSSGGYGSGGAGSAPSSRNASRTSQKEIPLYIRADITFLRQDFSVQQLLTTLPGLGLSSDFRFDYLVRTRTVSPKAVSEMRNLPKKGEDSEQRQALLFALRKLSGTDRGKTFADWKPLLPETDINTEADKLAQQLVKAIPVRQADLIAKFRDRKGVIHTEALVRAIPRLPADMRDRARDALAERMLRMTAATLQDKLQDDSVETRRAALVACISKEDKSLIPPVIPLLEDDQPLIARLAHR